MQRKFRALLIGIKIVPDKIGRSKSTYFEVAQTSWARVPLVIEGGFEAGW